MKSYSSREVIKILKAHGWYEVACDGDHHQFKHSTKNFRQHFQTIRDNLSTFSTECILLHEGDLFKLKRRLSP